MWTKKETETFLLGFAITTIIWVLLFGFIIGTISSDYEQKIQDIKKEVIIYKEKRY